MKSYPTKYCADCGAEYQPSGPAARFCHDCGAKRRESSAKAATLAYQIKRGVKIGSGKGGNNAKGSDDNQFKTGISFFMEVSKTIREERRYCERCSKDLISAQPSEWATHHRDHDRTNNVLSNFELLCKRCHQLEHDCEDNFSKVQRPSRKGVGDSVPEAPDTLAA